MSTSTHLFQLAQRACTHALCSCGLSKKGLFCDGRHLGSGQVPQILKLETDQSVFLCNCGMSAKRPFCASRRLQMRGIPPGSSLVEILGLIPAPNTPNFLCSETALNHSPKAIERLNNLLRKANGFYVRVVENLAKSFPLAMPTGFSAFHADVSGDDKWSAGVFNRCRRSPRTFCTQGSIAPAGRPPQGGGYLADRAAHVAGGSDVDCDLGARTIGVGVVLKTLQATNRTYIGPATRKRTAIGCTLIAGAGIGWGRTNLGDDECGAFFSKAHFLPNQRASGGSLASFKILRNGYSSQNTNDGHHDHQFNQGETFCCSLSLPNG